MAEYAGAKWPAAQATVNFIGGHEIDPPGYGPERGGGGGVGC